MIILRLSFVLLIVCASSARLNGKLPGKRLNEATEIPSVMCDAVADKRRGRIL